MSKSAGGWIKWYRRAEQNDVLKDDHFDKYHAFLYLVEKANITPVDIPIGNQTLHMERGQLFTSVRKLAKIWNWSLGKTHRFLGTLCGTHMIHTNSIMNGTLITIEKYSDFQGSRNTNGNTYGNRSGNTDGLQDKNIKKNNKKKRPKNALSVSGFPEEPETEADVWPGRKTK